MARRFKRQNFLFPLDLRQNSISPVATPTNTFVAASQGALLGRPEEPFPVPRPPETNAFLQLAQALETVNPAIQEFFTNRTEQYKEASLAEGNRIFNERGKGRLSWKQLISDVRKNEGDAVADELLKLNPYVEIAYNENYVRGAALEMERSIQQMYDDNVEIEFEDGSKVKFKDIQVGSGKLQEFFGRVERNYYKKFKDSGVDMAQVQKMFEPFAVEIERQMTDALLDRNLESKIVALEDSTARMSSYTLELLQTDPRFTTGTADERTVALTEAGQYITDTLDAFVDVVGSNDPRYVAMAQRIARNIAQVAEETRNPALLELLDLIKTGPVRESETRYETKVDANGVETQEPVEVDGFELRPSLLDTYIDVKELYNRTKQTITSLEWQNTTRQWAEEDRQQAKSLELAQNKIASILRQVRNGERSFETAQAEIDAIISNPDNFDNAAQLFAFSRDIVDAIQDERSQKVAAEFLNGIVSGMYGDTQTALTAINQAYASGNLQFDEYEGLTMLVKRENDRISGELYDTLYGQANEFVRGVAEQAGYFLKPDGTSVSYKDLIEQTTGFTPSQLAEQPDDIQLQVFRSAQQKLSDRNGFGIDIDQETFKAWINKGAEAERMGQRTLDPFVLNQMRNDFILQGFANYARQKATGIQANPSLYTQIAGETLSAFQGRASSLFQNNNSYLNRGRSGLSNQPIDVQNWWNTKAAAFENAVRGKNYNWGSRAILSINSINEYLQMAIKTNQLPPSLEIAASQLGISGADLLLRQAELQGIDTTSYRQQLQDAGLMYLLVPKDVLAVPSIPSRNDPRFNRSAPGNAITSPNKLPAPPSL